MAVARFEYTHARHGCREWMVVFLIIGFVMNEKNLPNFSATDEYMLVRCQDLAVIAILKSFSTSKRILIELKGEQVDISSLKDDQHVATVDGFFDLISDLGLKVVKK